MAPCYIQRQGRPAQGVVYVLADEHGSELCQVIRVANERGHAKMEDYPPQKGALVTVVAKGWLHAAWRFLADRRA